VNVFKLQRGLRMHDALLSLAQIANLFEGSWQLHGLMIP
jgi:hypothetical protein